MSVRADPTWGRAVRGAALACEGQVSNLLGHELFCLRILIPQCFVIGSPLNGLWVTATARWLIALVIVQRERWMCCVMFVAAVLCFYAVSLSGVFCTPDVKPTRTCMTNPIWVSNWVKTCHSLFPTTLSVAVYEQFHQQTFLKMTLMWWQSSRLCADDVNHQKREWFRVRVNEHALNLQGNDTVKNITCILGGAGAKTISWKNLNKK